MIKKDEFLRKYIAYLEEQNRWLQSYILRITTPPTDNGVPLPPQEYLFQEDPADIKEMHEEYRKFNPHLFTQPVTQLEEPEEVGNR